MQKFLLTSFFLIFLAIFLSKNFQSLSFIKFLPDFLSILVATVVLARAALVKVVKIPSKYVLIIVLMTLNIIAGILINGVGPGSLFVAMQFYLKFVPFFLLPLVYDFSKDDILGLLKFLFVILLIQFPVSFYQRFVQYKGIATGDFIVGTLELSSILSIVLISGIAMIVAFYQKGDVSRRVLLIAVVLFSLPTTINETKSTLVMLPVALFLPIFISGQANIKKIFTIMAGCSVFFIVFVAAYDYSFSDRYNRSFLDVAGDFKYYARYLAPTTTGLNENGIGKLDKIILPLDILSETPVKLFVGLGVGNVTESSMLGFEGDYMEYVHKNYVGNTTSYLIWETGVLGLFASLVFLWQIFKDSVLLSKQKNLNGSIALGWSVVTVIFFISLSYKNILLMNSIMYPFVFLSGYIIHLKWNEEKERENAGFSGSSPDRVGRLPYTG